MGITCGVLCRCKVHPTLTSVSMNIINREHDINVFFTKARKSSVFFYDIKVFIFSIHGMVSGYQVYEEFYALVTT